MEDAKWEVLVLNVERNLDFISEIEDILYGKENKRYLFDNKNSAIMKKEYLDSVGIVCVINRVFQC